MEWVCRYLLDKGLLHGDCLTVTGRTLRENLQVLRSHQVRSCQAKISHSTQDRSHKIGHLLYKLTFRLGHDSQVRSQQLGRNARVRLGLIGQVIVVQGVSPMSEDNGVVYPLERPIKASGHLQILYGNLVTHQLMHCCYCTTNALLYCFMHCLSLYKQLPPYCLIYYNNYYYSCLFYEKYEFQINYPGTTLLLIIYYGESDTFFLFYSKFLLLN